MKARVVKIILLIGLLYLMFAAILGCNDAAELSNGAGRDEPPPEDAVEEPPQTYAPGVIAALDADYYIDYENGAILIGDLPIGAWVFDPSYLWECCTGYDHTSEGVKKTVTGIVVSKDHRIQPTT